MSGFTDDDEELTKHEHDDDDKLAVIGMVLINAIREYAPKEEIQKLLDEDAPLWYQDEEDGWSALHVAASIEDAELVTKLLQHGAVWNSGETSFPFLLSSRT